MNKRLARNLTVLTIALLLSQYAAANGAIQSSSANEAMQQARAEQSALAKSVSVEDVGDADSYGRNVTYIGVAQTGNVNFQNDCTPLPGDPPLGPDDRCITLGASGSSTNFNERDIGRIDLPKNATKSLICFGVTSFPLWNYFNPNPTPVTGRFRFLNGFTIENELLDDPTLIDPTTGLPFNGVIEQPLGSPVLEFVTLQPGQSDLKRTITSRTCIGGIISKRSLAESYGLPPNIVDKFFKKPIKIRLNLTGSMTYVDSANIFYGVRFYGD
jgi:V8-like Glu-specific endopeptidase